MADTSASMPAYGTPFLNGSGLPISEPWFRFLLALQLRTGGQAGNDYVTTAQFNALSGTVTEQGKEIDGQAVPLPTKAYVMKPADPIGVFVKPPQNLYEGNVVPPYGTAAQAAAGTFLRAANNLSDVASASTSRTNLGLGTAAVQNVAFFLQSANNLSDVANAGTSRTNLGLGTIATQNANAVAITGGSVNGTTVGAGTPSTGAFTTVTASSTITPSQTAGLVGTTTNNNANAGSFGEYLTATTTATALTTAVAANATSVSLTAGDWDVESVVFYTPTGTTSFTAVYAGISTTSATLGAFGTYTKNTYVSTGAVLNNNVVVTSPVVRISLSATTTVFAIGQGNFTVSTLTCDGFIRARRVR